MHTGRTAAARRAGADASPHRAGQGHRTGGAAAGGQGGAENGIGGRGIRTDRRQALAADRTAAQRSDRVGALPRRRHADEPVGLPVGKIPQRLQCPEQVVLGDDRHHAGKILHCTAGRTGQGTAGIQ